jgi:hypothetical protein
MRNNSKYMTLKELFIELGLSKKEKEKAMKRAGNQSLVLASQVGMNWNGGGWERVDESDRHLKPHACAWCYQGTSNGFQFLFMKKDRSKVIRILKLKDDDNEDYLLGATND